MPGVRRDIEIIALTGMIWGCKRHSRRDPGELSTATNERDILDKPGRISVKNNPKSRLARIRLYRFIRPLGLTTYGLLVLSIIYGILGLSFMHHRIIAVFTLIIASTHGLTVALLYIKRRTYRLSPNETRQRTEEFLNMCICSGCPSWTECGEKGGFCLSAIGKSSCITEEKGCICPRCPVTGKMGFKHDYYCTRGSEKKLLEM